MGSGVLGFWRILGLAVLVETRLRVSGFTDLRFLDSRAPQISYNSPIPRARSRDPKQEQPPELNYLSR